MLHYCHHLVRPGEHRKVSVMCINKQPYQIRENDILWKFYCKAFSLRGKNVKAPSGRCSYVEGAFVGFILDLRTDRPGRFALNAAIIAYVTLFIWAILMDSPQSVQLPPGYEMFNWKMSFFVAFAISCMLWAFGMILIVTSQGRRFLKVIYQYFNDLAKSICTSVLPPPSFNK